MRAVDENGNFVGSESTNTTPESQVSLKTKAKYTVKYQFIPASRGPYTQRAAGCGAKSDSLAGALLFFEFATPMEIKRRQRKLGALEDLEYRTPQGNIVVYKGHSIAMHNIDSEDTVKVYFSRDALDENRKNPLFQLGPMTHHCILTIFEAPGLAAHSPVAKLDYFDPITNTGWYVANLSGATWLKCTPPFSSAQAHSLLAQWGFNDPSVGQAMDIIYGGNLLIDPSGAVQICLDYPSPVASSARHRKLTIKWNASSWGPSSNVAKNAAGYGGFTDVVRRVHPFAYACVIAAAMKAELRELCLSSSWRPMIGSCGHRHSVGLDVASLKDSSGHVYGFAWTNMSTSDALIRDKFIVSEKEYIHAKNSLASKKKSFQKTVDLLAKQQSKCDSQNKKLTSAQSAVELSLEKLNSLRVPSATKRQEMERAKALVLAEKNVARKQQELEKARISRDIAQSVLDETIKKREHAEVELREANDEHGKAKAEYDMSKRDWDAAVVANEPDVVSLFRSHLIASRFVRQVFDPWFMDANTLDSIPGDTNIRRSGNERLHLDHLHVTCIDQALDAF